MIKILCSIYTLAYLPLRWMFEKCRCNCKWVEWEEENDDRSYNCYVCTFPGIYECCGKNGDDPECEITMCPLAPDWTGRY